MEFTGAAALVGGPYQPQGSVVLVDISLRGLRSEVERTLASHGPACVDVASSLRYQEYDLLAGAAALIVGARGFEGAPSYPWITRLRTVAPHIGVYAVTPSLELMRALLVPCALAGVDDVMQLKTPAQFEALRHLIRDRVQAPPPERELRLLAEGIPSQETRTVVLYCARNGFRRLSVESVSRWFAQPERSLAERLFDLQQPPVGLICRFGMCVHQQAGEAPNQAASRDSTPSRIRERGRAPQR